MPWFTCMFRKTHSTKKATHTHQSKYAIHTHKRKYTDTPKKERKHLLTGVIKFNCGRRNLPWFTRVCRKHTEKKHTRNTHTQTHPKKSGNIVLPVSLSSIVGGATCHGLHLCSVWYASRACTRNLCCSVLQCVAMCCDVLQCFAVCCSVLQCVAVCCSVLQCVAVCCSVLECVAVCWSVL